MQERWRSKSLRDTQFAEVAEKVSEELDDDIGRLQGLREVVELSSNGGSEIQKASCKLIGLI